MEEAGWQPRSPIVTVADLPRLSSLHRVVVLHCGAIWNIYDQVIDARLFSLQQERAPDIGIYAIDFDREANFEFFRHWQVLNIPALVCLIRGDWQETWTGLWEQTELKAKLRIWLLESAE